MDEVEQEGGLVDEREAPLDYEVAHRTIRRLLNEDCLIISDECNCFEFS